MSPLEGFAGEVAWATKNIAYNLGFIPEDKLSWKPAESAKSAYEIVGEVVYVLTGMPVKFETGSFPEAPPAAFTSLKEAQEAVEQAGAKYAEYLRGFAPERLGETVDLGWGEFPMPRALSIPVVEAVHHHGQIAYIQTLLGDTESHFYELANQG